ncbi:MAG: isoprenyl transferase, partial [Bacteroidota bacterium]
IIMDGNGRWAKQQGEERIFGHQHGVRAVRDTVEAAAELGINYLTLYAFSTENWNRPKEEVDALMGLLVQTIHGETPTLNKNDIRLQTIGDTQSLPDACRSQLLEAIEATSNNQRMTLVLALSYSSKWEITEAARKIAREVKAGTLDANRIDEQTITERLTTAGMPDPELLIRTSGEYRISNFLLWQIAYAELHFTEKLWPEFGKEDLYQAIIDFQKRERRFGRVSEQLQP